MQVAGQLVRMQPDRSEPDAHEQRHRTTPPRPDRRTQHDDERRPAEIVAREGGWQPGDVLEQGQIRFQGGTEESIDFYKELLEEVGGQPVQVPVKKGS